MTVFGKLFADPADAASAEAVLGGLHDEQAATGRPVVPRPLGAVGGLGMALTAAIGSPAESPVSGVEMLRLGPLPPAGALAVAAEALATIHCSRVRPEGRVRTGAHHAASVAARVNLLAAHLPGLAPRLCAAGDELGARLAAGDAAVAPVHAGFKSS